MSCWVVPAVAAELWQMPIGQIVEKAKAGEIPTKTDLGFMLVDVAPNSPKIVHPLRPPAAAPKTYVTVEVPSEAVSAEEKLDWRPTRARMRNLRRPPARPMAMAA